MINNNKFQFSELRQRENKIEQTSKRHTNDDSTIMTMIHKPANDDSTIMTTIHFNLHWLPLHIFSVKIYWN